MKTALLLTILMLPAAAAPMVYAQSQAGASDRGIDVVDVVTATATVEKLDVENRKATLLMEDGKSKNVNVGKDVRNFDQVKVGDKVHLTYADEILIVIGHSDANPGAEGAGAAQIAPKGSRPGGVMVESSTIVAKILAVDTGKRKVTLEGPHGEKKTIKLSGKVPLDKLKVGETVEVQVTEALAVEVI